MIPKQIGAVLFDGNGVIYERREDNTLTLLGRMLAEVEYGVEVDGVKDAALKEIQHDAFAGRVSKWGYWDYLLRRLGEELVSLFWS